MQRGLQEVLRVERERAELIDGIRDGRIKVFAVGNQSFYLNNNEGTDGDDNLTGEGLLDGKGGNDALTGADKLDVLDGGEGSDFLYGRGGRDVLIGGADADVLDGGAEFDTVSYAAAASGVVVNLANAAQNTGEAAGDTYISVEDVYGTEHADTLIGNAGANDLMGDKGNDTLDGGQGDDRLDGGEGYDFASYMNAGVAVAADLSGRSKNLGQAYGDRYDSIEGVQGSAFHDTLTGSAQDNELYGHEGDDILHGQAGADYLAGGGGSDVAHGGEGDDVLEGGWSGHDWLFGGSGQDVLNAGDGDDVLDGGSGADRLVGGVGYDYASYATALGGVTVRLWAPWTNTGDAAGDVFESIEGLHGSLHADTIEGNSGANYLFGRGGWDSLAGLDGNDYLFGEDGNDTLAGGNGDDVLSGGDGTDRLVGGWGADRLDGGAGWDIADYSGAAARVVVDLILIGRNAGEAFGDSFVAVDEVWGSHYNDELFGDTLDNALRGNAGNDVLEGRGGRDHLNGGDGFDCAAYTGAEYGVVASLLNRFINTGDAWGDGYVSIEGLLGSRHGDTLQGDHAGNELYGHDGDDVLKGEGGNDYLVGGAGHDTLAGGAGHDHLVGGVGYDVFRFDAALGAGNVDTIEGFAAGDRIGLSQSVFGPIGQSAFGYSMLKTSEFALGAAATTSDHRIVYDQASGALYYDADGTGAAAQIRFAILKERPLLTASSFVIEL